MKIEAGREMDKRRVINWLNEIYAKPGRVFLTHTDDELKMFAYDTLVLLKEKEEVVHPEPSCELNYITDCCCDFCGVQLIREDNFCRGCGRPIKWGEG